MTYNTTPITSGAAKFSTLDPDAPLFLEENNITVGANPANPATLYDYDTSTLHITNIEANNGQLDIHNADLIGVNQFVCQDYLGAVSALASDNLRWTLTLNNVNGSTYSKKFRVPSNFVNNSSVKLSFYATNTSASAHNIKIYKYSEGSYTDSGYYASIPGNTTTASEFSTTLSNISAGELYCFYTLYNSLTFLGASGLKIQCDLTPVTSGYWAISD